MGVQKGYRRGSEGDPKGAKGVQKEGSGELRLGKGEGDVEGEDRVGKAITILFNCKMCETKVEVMT